MRPIAIACLALFLLAPRTSLWAKKKAQASAHALVARFLATGSAEKKAALATEIIDAGLDFDAVLQELRSGRHYAADAPKGRLLRERKGLGSVRYPYMILVPDDYTPTKRWPVRFYLHGGMGAKEWKALDGAWAPSWKRAYNQLVIVPAGWWDSMWWEWSQVDNLEAILAEVRRTWNIDENRVVMYGGSDGGAALFFYAMRHPDRWAGYAGQVAPPDRLVRADFRPDGQMHVSNLARQSVHLGYGEKDTKVPLQFIEKYMALFQKNGADIEWYVLPGQGHALRFPEERERQLGRFLWHTFRDPLPDKLSWATERTDRYARRAWLIIDELALGTTPVDTSNILPRWGTPIQLRGPTTRKQAWGRVELERVGNRVSVKATRVKRFRLLVSPDEFDLSKPIIVEVDGKVLFDEVVTASLTTLLHWAAIDDDRTCLFAAEIPIALQPK